MKDKHTPGPWRVSKNDSIYAGDEFIGIALSGKPWGKELPQKSNARLMAAAPELLESLKDLLQYGHIGGLFHTRDNYYKARTQAMNLVAKIEGDEKNTDS